MQNKTRWGLVEFLAPEGRIIISAPEFDHDTFPEVGEELVRLLSAEIVERQLDADLHSWLIDFEGCRIFLRAEHYSESVWLQALQPESAAEEMAYLASLFRKGF